MDKYKLFIDGKFMDAASGKTFISTDPGTELPIAEIAQAGKVDAEAAIAAARRAFDRGDWSGLTPAARAAKVQDFADHVARLSIRLAATESMDSGQVIKLAGYWPLLGTVLLRNLCLAATSRFSWEEEIPVSGNMFAPGRDYVVREPIGVCVGIIPWNFPLAMAFWKLAPALIMGNTVIIKPASVTSLSALILAEAAQAAGFPPGVVNIIAGPGGELGKVLCTHPDVDKIAFTGSTEVGREIMRMASDTVKKVTLELGGKSANIILDDADMDLATDGACFGTFFHQGQVCESGTRVLVNSRIYDQFVERMKKRVEDYRIGYQLNPDSHMGPLVSKEQLTTVEKYVKLGKEEGAQLITGGKRVEAPGIKGGYYYAPTIFANVNNKMRIAQEEIFGPVVCVIKYDSDEEAVAIANDSIYGLGGGVFSGNTARAERVAKGVRTGTMWINNYHSFGDFCPFGGYKQSGVGRELGIAGLQEYTQIKRIHVNSIANHKSNFQFKIMSDDNKLAGFSYPGQPMLYAGHGSLSAIYKAVVDLGCKRAIVLTDPGVRATGLADQVKNALSGFYAGMFDNIPPDPDLATVDAATLAAREVNADCVVSCGGGSVIDTGKALCITLKNGGKANDHLNVFVLTAPLVPHIVIPTTSGTGSEVTNGAVITNPTAERKNYVFDHRLVPNVAILDPRFTMTLPKGMTAGSAMDALTHAIESMTSIAANTFSDAFALQSIRLISENLPLVIENGQNEDARLNMQIAAYLAGMALSVAMLGFAHSMAHSVGALHHVPHGVACGIVLPKVMRYNADHATDKLAQVAQAMGVNTASMTKKDAALAAADAVEALMQKVGHPMRLRDVGFPEDNIPVCALHSIGETVTIFNPRPVMDPNEVIQLFTQCY